MLWWLSIPDILRIFAKLASDRHDMFDALCSEAVVNRHAANIKLQYRF